jgi:hypothetical protein
MGIVACLDLCTCFRVFALDRHSSEERSDNGEAGPKGE